ncbi:MAG: hypothetical protein ACREHD_22695 [Pirellulales bacterium]
MRLRQSGTNPFYVLLVIVGIAFALTACAYSVMTLRAVHSPEADANRPRTGLLEFLDRHGAALMGGELALLALATVAAISTDRYWMRRALGEYRASQSPQPPNESRPSPPT